jgi:gas vesicle protein
MSRTFIALLLAVAFVFVSFDRAEAHCCARPHKSHPVTTPSHPGIPPHQEHCCNRAESELGEVSNQLVAVRTELTNIRNALNDAEKDIINAINKSGEDVKKQVKDTGEDVKKQVKDTGETVKQQVKDTGEDVKKQVKDTEKNIVNAINKAAEEVKKEIQAARYILDALFSRPNSLSVKVGNQAITDPPITPSSPSQPPPPPPDVKGDQTDCLAPCCLKCRP